jgi:CTD small phosphatase-like protein 2
LGESCRAAADRCGLLKLAKRWGFALVPRPSSSAASSRHGQAPFVKGGGGGYGGTVCPHDGLPARLLTFANNGPTTVSRAAHFAGAVRRALQHRVAAGQLLRGCVDPWGSWALVPRPRYENYFEFDPDAPFRFHLNVPPYSCIAASRQWHLSEPAAAAAARPGLPGPAGGQLQPPRASLVLDLDETLIHTEVDFIPDADFTFCLPGGGDNGLQVMYVRVRPHALAFLAFCAAKFEVIVFTASERPYAEAVLRHLDPAGLLVDHVLCREDCTFVDGEFTKDLGALSRDMRRVALVDNRPEMYCFHAANGVPVSSWFEDRRDCELLRLRPKLEAMAAAKDVREYVTHHWRTHEAVARVAAAMALLGHQGSAAAAGGLGDHHPSFSGSEPSSNDVFSSDENFTLSGRGAGGSSSEEDPVSPLHGCGSDDDDEDGGENGGCFESASDVGTDDEVSSEGPAFPQKYQDFQCYEDGAEAEAEDE